MKKAKRLLAGLLTAVMLLALLPTAFAAEDDPLTRGEARDLLLAAADDYNPGVTAEDILQGDKDGNLYLDRPVTRVELLVMLSNAFGELPSKNALVAQVLGTFLAPITSLAVVLDQIAKKGGAPEEEPKAEEAPAAEAAPEAPAEAAPEA